MLGTLLSLPNWLVACCEIKNPFDVGIVHIPTALHVCTCVSMAILQKKKTRVSSNQQYLTCDALLSLPKMRLNAAIVYLWSDILMYLPCMLKRDERHPTLLVCSPAG
eukprot:m.209613 g.209613  ORF g.209613 m.209613 type:complete len:107 (+) comp18990_c0_seq2:983-1303(+)